MKKLMLGALAALSFAGGALANNGVLFSKPDMTTRLFQIISAPLRLPLPWLEWAMAAAYRVPYGIRSSRLTNRGLMGVNSSGPGPDVGKLPMADQNKSREVSPPPVFEQVHGAHGSVEQSPSDENRIIEDHGHILVVDDDPQIRLLVARFLQRHGYRVTSAQDGHAMREIFRSSPTDLVVLDVMLPGRSGLDLCKEVRATSSIPIIMLTARSDEADRIVGLEMGADDYITKPFSPRELLARVRAVLRRARSRADEGPAVETSIKRFDGWRLDLRRRELTSPANVLVDLSTGEFDLLVALVERPSRVLSREMLMELAKTRSSDPFDRTIDVQISRLRRKLESDDNGGQLIKTVRGAGYMFAPQVELTV